MVPDIFQQWQAVNHCKGGAFLNTGNQPKTFALPGLVLDKISGQLSSAVLK
jgi:hypothetical protein